MHALENTFENELIMAGDSLLMTSDMLRYYTIFPKSVTSENAEVFITADSPPEIRLELEMILGLEIKFIPLGEEEIAAHDRQPVGPRDPHVALEASGYACEDFGPQRR